MTKVPKYLRHSSGQARVIINGKAMYLGKHGSKASQQRYDALIAEFLASNRSPTFGITEAEVTIGDLIVAYMAHAKRYYGTKSTSEWVRVKPAFRLLADLYKAESVAEFGPLQFKAVRQKMIDRGWSRTYTNANMKRILRMVKWGASEGMYPAAIYDTLKLIPSLQRGRTEARETKPVLPVSEEDIAATIKQCTPVVADMIRVQLLCGCRPGELCKLTPGMIDRCNDVWEANLSEHKTAHHGRSRTIRFGPEAQEILKPYLLRHEDSPLFSPRESEMQRRGSIPRKTPLNQGNRKGYGVQSRKGDRIISMVGCGQPLASL